MADSDGARQANLLAVLGLGVSDRIRQAEELSAGLGAAAPAAIVALHEFLDGGSVDDLRGVVGLTPSGAVRLIDRLESAELVRRRPGTSDARSVSVVLTARGRRTAERILAARQRTSEALLERLTDSERQALTPLLERLAEELTKARLADREAGDVPQGGWLCRLCDFSACGRPRGACPVAGAASALTR